MRLDAFLLCDAAEVSGGKVSMLGAGITRFSFPAFPGVSPLLTIVARFIFDEGEELAGHPFRLEAHPPTGPEMVRIEGTIEGDWGTLAEGEERYINLVLVFGPIVFQSPGLYRIQLFVGGNIVRDMRLPVLLPE